MHDPLYAGISCVNAAQALQASTIIYRDKLSDNAFIIHPVTFEEFIVGVTIDSVAVHLSIKPLTLIDITICELLDSTTMLEIFFPVT
jgi:hypothetical protein